MIGPVHQELPTGTVTFLFTDVEGSRILLGEVLHGEAVESDETETA